MRQILLDCEVDMYETFEKYRESIERLYISENKNFCQPHFHRHVEILYVLESGLLVTVNGKSKLMQEGEVAVIDSFDTHSYTNPQQLRSISIVIPVSLCPAYKERTKRMKLAANFLTDTEACDEMLCLIRLMQKHTYNIDEPLYLTTHYSHADEAFILGCLATIMGIVLRSIPFVKRNDEKDENLTKNILIYLDEHYSEDLSLDSLADHFGYSKYYFSRICQKILDSSLTKYLNKIRILKILEDKNNKTLTELATKHGFTNMRTFQRAFKDVTGITASAYKANKFIL